MPNRGLDGYYDWKLSGHDPKYALKWNDRSDLALLGELSPLKDIRGARINHLRLQQAGIV